MPGKRQNLERLLQAASSFQRRQQMHSTPMPPTPVPKLRRYIEATENVWRTEWFGLCLVGLSAILATIWHVWVPSPGYSVVAMAVVAGVMALRPDMRGREKFLWLFILFVYAGAEIRAIKHDRKEQTDQFQNIANRLTDSIKTITGGDSFCYFTFVPVSDHPAGPIGWVAVSQRGRFPLHSVVAIMYEMGKFKYTPRPNSFTGIPYLKFPLGDLAVGASGVLPSYAFTNRDREGFSIYFTALNGYWLEEARVRRITRNTWAQAVKVTNNKDGKDEVLFEQIDPNYPRINGNADWEY